MTYNTAHKRVISTPKPNESDAEHNAALVVKLPGQGGTKGAICPLTALFGRSKHCAIVCASPARPPSATAGASTGR